MPETRETPAACTQCGGAGFLVEQKVGAAARARRCGCQETCPRCGESGYTLIQAGQAKVAQICACRHLDQRLSVFNEIGIPAALARASFETFRSYSNDQARAKTACEEFARKFRSD